LYDVDPLRCWEYYFCTLFSLQFRDFFPPVGLSPHFASAHEYPLLAKFHLLTFFPPKNSCQESPAFLKYSIFPISLLCFPVPDACSVPPTSPLARRPQRLPPLKASRTFFSSLSFQSRKHMEISAVSSLFFSSFVFSFPSTPRRSPSQPNPRLFFSFGSLTTPLPLILLRRPAWLSSGPRR